MNLSSDRHCMNGTASKLAVGESVSIHSAGRGRHPQTQRWEGLLHELVSTDPWCPEGTAGRMSPCPSPIQRSSATPS